MLHDWRIDDREYARHESRRGRRHAVTALDPQRTALVVVDMVSFFAQANAYVQGIVPNINELAIALRTAGGTVAWVVPVPSPNDAWGSEFFGAAIFDGYQESGGTGPIADRLWPELVVGHDDVFCEKSAPSAFFPGRCDLAEQLRKRGIDTVVVVGTVANVCCESTVRDASTLGYRTIMIADANAAGSNHVLNATLHTVYRSFGDVRTTAEVVELIEAST